MAGAPPIAPAIPGYRIERTIGRGGMAIVYLAVQQSLDRQVALKVLDRTLAREPQFVARFLGEARVLASMHHRNIVAIHDVGEHDGSPYLAMEYFPEGSMLPLCGTLGETDVLRCVRDVAAALEHAHARGVVHRDVKPDNVFRHADGVSMLGDFGIARGHLRDGGATAEGRALGTPQYMAPERWRDQPGDPRSDLYSLGVTLYALATGEVPYDGDHPLSIGMRHANDPVPRLPSKFARMQGLLASLMAKSPDQRAPSAGAVVQHVDALLAESDAAPGAGAMLARTSTARMLLEWPFRSSDPLAAAATGPARRSWPWLAAAAAAVLAAVVAVAVWRFGSPADESPGSGRVVVPTTVALAILPFSADDSDLELARLAGVLTNDLTNGLARHRGLLVAERSASDTAHAQRLADPQLAERLRVGYALQGTLIRRGESLAVDAQLRELPSGRVRWESTFDGMYERFWELESRVVGAVTAVLTPSIEPAAAGNPVGGSSEAFVRYLKGRQLLDASAGPASAAAAALEFEAALLQAPGSAVAYAGLCQAQLKVFESGRDAQQFERANEACEAALRADPGLSEVMLALGELYRLKGEGARALEFYRRAEADPALRLFALIGLGNAHHALGQPVEAERYLRSAVALQPGSWQTHKALGNFFYHSGRFLEAVDTYRVAIALAPSSDTSVYNNLGGCLMQLDRLEEAEQAFSQSLERKRSKSTLSNLGTTKFALGRYADAVALYREALILDPDDYRLYANLADSLSMIGGAPAAIESNYRQAADRARRYLATRTDAVEVAAELAWFEANLGESGQARALLDSVASAEDPGAGAAFLLAITYARIGDLEQARVWRANALKAGYSKRIVESTPWFSAL